MKIILNGKPKQVREGETVLDAARRAGIDIPALCSHDALEPYGACRLCIVEVTERGKKRSKVVASCLYPVKEGLDVRTGTAKIVKLRKFLIELLLARSPETPYVRELAARYGVTKTRFLHPNDPCILCGLCVRVCAEVVGANAIGFSQRGITRRIDSPFGMDHSRCVACGACTYVCPTGAIQMEYTRVAELRKEGGEHRCRYTLMGLLPNAVCALNYECFRCEIDQKFRAEAGTHPLLARVSRPAGKTRAAKRPGGGRGRKKARG
jgi:bidirectional [NiFe] hydrogenase diaphorase subunit